MIFDPGSEAAFQDSIMHNGLEKDFVNSDGMIEPSEDIPIAGENTLKDSVTVEVIVADS